MIDFLQMFESIVINSAYGFCFALGISITSQGVMEYIDWLTWDRRESEKITEYSVKIGLGITITIIFLKMYFTR